MLGGNPDQRKISPSVIPEVPTHQESAIQDPENTNLQTHAFSNIYGIYGFVHCFWGSTSNFSQPMNFTGRGALRIGHPHVHVILLQIVVASEGGDGQPEFGEVNIPPTMNIGIEFVTFQSTTTINRKKKLVSGARPWFKEKPNWKLPIL